MISQGGNRDAKEISWQQDKPEKLQKLKGNICKTVKSNDGGAVDEHDDAKSLQRKIMPHLTRF